jgi:hypothetical protein
MAATVTRRASWGVLTISLVFVFNIGLFAQSRPAAASTSAPSVAPDLNATLAELMRVTPATNEDLVILQQRGARLQWVTFWREDKAHNAQMSEALRRNLQFAVPSLIHDTLASGGSLSTTFKLYRDLTVVCESLDSLLPPGSRENKAELRAVNNDLSDMNRLREDLYSYLQQTAAAIERKNAQRSSSAGRSPIKIIVDDNIPDKPSPKNGTRPNK